MIRSLRRKFILIAMASLVGTMAVLFAAIGAGNHYAAAKRADLVISLLRENGGAFLPPGPRSNPASFDFQITPETPFETRYFIVKLTARGEIWLASLDHIAALDRQGAADTISRITASGAERGYVDHYRFGVFPDGDGGRTIIGLDCFLQLQSANNMLRVTAAIFLICALAVFILLLFLSKRAVRPFAENLERQRRFITDASHELKTPLAILSADLGLLEDACGADKWLESAKAQALRLDRLIQELVELARTEETVEESAVELFSVSEIAWASADAFQPLAEAEGKRLEADIADGIQTKGVQDNFFRLFSILLDNAVKYCDPAGTVRLSAALRGRNICIRVSNPCRDADAAQLRRCFDRFYRADSSRARSTGGCGIGLSTAKAIAARHKGRIYSRCRDGTVAFTAVIPQAR